jgi:F-box-like
METNFELIFSLAYLPEVAKQLRASTPPPHLNLHSGESLPMTVRINPENCLASSRALASNSRIMPFPSSDSASLESMVTLFSNPGPSLLDRIPKASPELDKAEAVDLEPPTPIIRPDAKTVHLPVEVVENILSFLPRLRSKRHITQVTLYNCTLVSRLWYDASIALLYAHPHLTGRNFDKFAAIICPSINAHIRKSELAGLVKNLDMGELVHDGSKALTARLLGRVKGSLEEFRAPQATFAYVHPPSESDSAFMRVKGSLTRVKDLQAAFDRINCFAALRKCSKLRVLDFSLISESIPLKELFNTMQHLTALQSLYFPRTSNHDRGFSRDQFTWAPNLEELHLQGGISANFLHLATAFPDSLHTVSIQHCAFARVDGFRTFLIGLSPQLTNLKLTYSLPAVPYNGFDYLLCYCPNLTNLTIAVDYISRLFFDESNIPKPNDSGHGHPLETLQLESSGTLGTDRKIEPNDVFIAVAEGVIPNLRRLRVNERLKWHQNTEWERDVRDLVDLLETKEREDYEGVESEDGGSEVADDDVEEVIREPTYTPKAGVWSFRSAFL